MSTLKTQEKIKGHTAVHLSTGVLLLSRRVSFSFFTTMQLNIIRVNRFLSKKRGLDFTRAGNGDSPLRRDLDALSQSQMVFNEQTIYYS